MFTKLTIIVVALSQYIAGSPLETAQPQHNVKQFPSPRIVGGEDAPKGYAKHMVALVMQWKHGTLFLCGASIISQRVVLSAAHCIDPYVYMGELSPYLKGVIGSNYWNSTDYMISYSGYKIHPEWDRGTLQNDVGLLFTDKKIVYSEFVGAIEVNYNFIEGGVKGSVTGWGVLGVDEIMSPARLQLLYVYIISPEQCDEGVRIGALLTGSSLQVNSTVDICTIHLRGHGMCFGDSGSALVSERKLVGVVSRGVPCARGLPDLYARASGFADFVRPELERLRGD